MPKKVIKVHESDHAPVEGAEQSVGLDTTGNKFKAVALYRTKENSQEYIAATITIDEHGVVCHVDFDEPCEYRVASMGAKVRFSNLFLAGPELL